MATFTEPFTTALSLTWTRTSPIAENIIMSGTTQGTLTGAENVRIRADHDVGGANMFTQITWVSGGNDTDRSLGVATRYAAAADTCYFFEVNDNLNRWQLLRVDAGTATSLSGGNVSRTITTPTTIRLESEGTTHRCYIDGVGVGAYSDGNLASNTRGGLASWNPGSLIVMDDFSTGTLTAPTVDSIRLPIQTNQYP